MSYLRIGAYFMFLVFVSFGSIQVQAQTTEVITSAPTPNITSPAPLPSQVQGKPMIVTPVPTAKELIAMPEGYVNCFTVEASWFKNAWIPEHRICQYQNAPGQTVAYEGVAWIDSYWACTQYTGSTCTKWEWKPGHWVKTLEVY